MITLSLDSVSLPSLPPHCSSHLGLQLSIINPSISPQYKATPRGQGHSPAPGPGQKSGSSTLPLV